MQIALAGNPNSGKTTLFNALTGSNQFVGNWPGVTVEKKEGKYKKNKEIKITDLPGIYSLSPYTLEEVVSREYLLNEKVDLVLNIVDGSNLERNLYLTTQLLELGIPCVVAINMIDVVNKKGDKIHADKLSKKLGCPVCLISAMKNIGLDEMMEIAASAHAKDTVPHNIYSKEVNHALSELAKQLPNHMEEKRHLFYCVKLFERDEKILDALKIKLNEAPIIKLEEEREDDSESIITDERYSYIAKIISECYDKKNREQMTMSDKIDRIVTHRVLALPIFALVMAAVYYVSVTSIGTLVTDWMNDTLFGEIIPPAIEGFLVSIGCADWLMSLILDGIVAGVGAVLGFVPQMFVLFAFLAVLEDCGYMARVAFIMDRLFRKFGLSGKSFIPMLIGTGCGVPGIMASRTIESERDRRMTIMTTTFIPCSAKLPIIGLIAGALFNGAWWVAPSAYFLGMTAIIVSGIILKKTKMFMGDPAPFVMELPAYHAPRIINVVRSMWERGYSFIKKAGTIILLATIVIWFLQTWGIEDGSFTMVEDINHSVLAMLGQAISWVFIPLGWGKWQMTVASITGLVAKEGVVSTLGQIYGFAEVAENGEEIWSLVANDFTMLSAYSFLAFNLLCAPCFAAMGAIKREMNHAKWTVFAIGYQCVFAYVTALIIYQIGNLFVNGIFTVWTVIAFIVLAGIVYLLVRKPNVDIKKPKVQYSVQ